MDEVFAWKRPAGFEGAVSRVSRDFASFETFFLPLFFFGPIFIFWRWKHCLAVLLFATEADSP